MNNLNDKYFIPIIKDRFTQTPVSPIQYEIQELLKTPE